MRLASDPNPSDLLSIPMQLRGSIAALCQLSNPYKVKFDANAAPTSSLLTVVPTPEEDTVCSSSSADAASP